MSSLRRIYYDWVAGCFAGLAGWGGLTLWGGSPLRQGALLGFLLGALLSGLEELYARNAKRSARGALVGGVAGAVGGALGGALGTAGYRTAGTYLADRLDASTPWILALYVAGWMVLGAFIGVSGGLLDRSTEKARQGVLGGLVGGLVGGVAFLAIPVGAWLGLALLGGSIGLFLALTEEFLTGVRLVVERGRGEGREIMIHKDHFTLGRDDRCDICLSGQEGVGLLHAEMDRSPDGLVVHDLGAGTGVYVNNERIQAGRLHDGDRVRLGGVVLRVRDLAAAILIALFASSAGADPGTTLRITQVDRAAWPDVRMWVSALDAQGNPVPGLSLQAFEEGRLVDARSGIGNPEGISFSLVLDRSGSMKGEKLDEAKRSIESFLGRLHPADRAGLVVFSDHVSRAVDLTGDWGTILDALRPIEADGHTALFDALAAGAEQLAPVSGRRAVVALTDGKANRGALDLAGAVRAATGSDVTISVIGLGEDVRGERLEGLARDTGGEYLFAPGPEGLERLYERIARNLHGEYLLEYRSQEDPRRGLITVRVEGSGASAERSYVPPEASLFGVPRRGAVAALALGLLGFVALAATGPEWRKRRCASCGTELRKAARFCPHCGTRCT